MKWKEEENGVVFGVGVKGEGKEVRVRVFCVMVMGEGVMADYG